MIRRSAVTSPGPLVLFAPLAMTAMTATLAMTACSVPKDAGFPDVARMVDDRGGHRVTWSRDQEGDARIRARVRELLAGELTEAGAIEIALLGNPTLQATYEELMIAQADLVQAGLGKNPRITGALGFSIPRSAGTTSYDVGLEIDFLDLVMIPARKRVADAQLEATKRRVGDEVLKLARDVRVAHATLLSAQQVAAMRHAVLDAADASLALAERQHEAGNISELDLANESGLDEQARLDAARSDADIETARERLIRLMGVAGAETRFTTTPRLAELPPSDPKVDRLEDMALAGRLDVDAARKELEARHAELALARDFRFLGGASVGASLSRDPEGHTVAGPTAALEIPIFDAKQAAVAKLEAGVRGARRRFEAQALAAQSEVREASARLAAARGIVERYRTRVIPLRERIVALSQRHYDAMLLGVYQVLLAKQAEVNAYREYIEAVRDYWIARADLERAVGGRLPATPTAPAQLEDSKP